MNVPGPVLLIGGSGMLGQAWSALLAQRGIETTAPSHAELDITHSGSIEKVLDARHPLVINCAAWTDVDGAESGEEAATRLNGNAVGYLAECCARIGATFVHYSTDYVFDGHATSPYQTDCPRNPISAYGRSKAVGEQLIEQSGCRFLLIRTSWLYAPWGKNFVRTMVNLMRQRPSVRVVADQRGRPTSAEHLARASLQLLAQQATGTHHVTDAGECTWHDFAAQIAQLIDSDCKVEPCTTAQFARPAPRPPYSVLDLTQTEKLIGPMPPWQDCLADVIGRLESRPDAPVHSGNQQKR
jgi:dTDP-4-dehydrorhamnose reductase